MLKKILRRLLMKRHYWRFVGFDELSELYVSQFLRSLGVSIIGIFMPIYLYVLGYNLKQILGLHIIWFGIRLVIVPILGLYVARFGPKHSMLTSQILYVLYLGFLLTIESQQWPLWIIATLGSTAYGLHILAVDVDFSKVKHSNNGGKELGYLTIMVKMGGVVGPLIGGLVANFWSPQASVAIAMVVILLSSIPLFLSKEPVRTRQHLSFKGLSYRTLKRDFVSVMAISNEYVISVIIWPLFAAIFVLGDNTFAKLGVIVAASTFSAIFFSRFLGSLIDNQQGGALLKAGIWANALLHLFRPFATTTVHAAGINLINEPVSAMYKMPYIKGMYDRADSLEGYRIAYLTSMAYAEGIARLMLWSTLFALSYFVSDYTVFVSAFFLGALFSIMISLQRYPALTRKGWGMFKWLP